MCSNNFEFLTDKTSNTKYFNLYAEFWFLYFISTPFNCLLLRFWFNLRYKIISMFYLTFTLLSFHLLHFISTPSNRSPTCIRFYLRYKNKKNYTKLSVVLFQCFEGCKFLPSLSLFSFPCIAG